MANTAPDFDFSAIITAAREWIEKCLIHDGSMFTEQAIWTAENLEQLREYFVEQPNSGEGTFLEKLAVQLAPASDQARMLMAELYWALQLFPSNSSDKTKARQFTQIAEQSGLDFNGGRWLSPEVQRGIGSAGTGYGAHFWREVAYAIHLGLRLKEIPESQRDELFAEHERLADWLEEEMKGHGDRQFRHMLRFFAFPDRVERMSSNRSRREVLLAFTQLPIEVSSTWTDKLLDGALLELRRKLAGELGTDILDFYESPLKEQWQTQTNIEDDTSLKSNDRGAVVDAVSALPALPTNMIFYGPPGTGKTRKIEHLRTLYSDTLSTVNREAWLAEMVANVAWLPVIVATLAHAGRPLRAVDIATSELALAKAQPTPGRPRKVTPPIQPYLYEHSVDTVQIPRSMSRRQVIVFDRDQKGDWILVSDWQDIVPQAAALAASWAEGPAAGTADVQRYRMVTFHPNYGYEDFVQGIRPVEDEERRVEFRNVDGTFKKLCDAAARNPSQRYAIFIDEINRGNISKIFGELITLIEADKRIQPGEGGSSTGMRVHLAGTDEPFGVPANVDIYGTMNTSDRSIALMDIALRRRFRFQEIGPDYAVLGEHVAGVDLPRLLRRINDRLEYLLDAEHRIGHGYLTSARSLDDLREVFANQIIPLLEEFFFDNRDAIAMVLSNQAGECRFVAKEALKPERLFAHSLGDPLRRSTARVTTTQPSEWTEEDFVSIYA